MIVLGGAVFLLQSPGSSGTGATTPTPTANLFGAGTSDPITAIDVVSGTKRVSLRQEVTGTTWLLIEPIKADADNFAVNNVADQLKTLQPALTITETKDIALYGLDKPPLQISVKTGGSKPGEATLLVGKTTPDGANYYVKVQGKDPIYVVVNSSIEPMKTWLDSPPKAQPTPTPMALTVLPADTPTLPGSSAPISNTNTGGIGPAITGTTTLTGTSPITSSVPGAANPTTPLPFTPAASPTSSK